MRILFIFLCFTLSAEVFGQHNRNSYNSKFNLLFGFDLSGTPFSYAQHQKVLRSGDAGDDGFSGNLHVGLQYRPKQTFSIEGGIQFLEFMNLCLDTAYLTRHPENRTSLLNLTPNTSLSPLIPESQLGFDIYYISYYLTATKYFPLGRVFSFYLSGGLSYNNRFLSYSGADNVFYDAKDDEVLELKFTDTKNYVGLLGEGGINLLVSPRTSLYAGFRYNTATKTIIQGDYTDRQSNVLINTDHVTTNGRYMGFVFHIAIKLFANQPPNINIRLPHIHISLPRIRLPKIHFRTSSKTKKPAHKKFRGKPTIKTPRFILQ